MFDPSEDFANVVDGTESITLLRRGRDPGDAGTVVAHALRRAAVASEIVAYNRSDVRKQLAADGQCESAEVVWHLPVVELIAAPRLGDVVLDASGRRWTILEVKRTTIGTRWRCFTRNLTVAYRLDDTITVLKATYAKTSCGAAEAVWRTWRTGIRARIQPVACSVDTKNESRCTVATYRILLAEDLTLDQTHCIVGPDGTTYRIVSSIGAERIGELQVLEAEVLQ